MALIFLLLCLAFFIYGIVWSVGLLAIFFKFGMFALVVWVIYKVFFSGSHKLQSL